MNMSFSEVIRAKKQDLGDIQRRITLCNATGRTGDAENLSRKAQALQADIERMETELQQFETINRSVK